MAELLELLGLLLASGRANIFLSLSLGAAVPLVWPKGEAAPYGAACGTRQGSLPGSGGRQLHPAHASGMASSPAGALSAAWRREFGELGFDQRHLANGSRCFRCRFRMHGIGQGRFEGTRRITIAGGFVLTVGLRKANGASPSAALAWRSLHRDPGYTPALSRMPVGVVRGLPHRLVVLVPLGHAEVGVRSQRFGGGAPGRAFPLLPPVLLPGAGPPLCGRITQDRAEYDRRTSAAKVAFSPVGSGIPPQARTGIIGRERFVHVICRESGASNRQKSSCPGQYWWQHPTSFRRGPILGRSARHDLHEALGLRQGYVPGIKPEVLLDQGADDIGVLCDTGLHWPRSSDKKASFCRWGRASAVTLRQSEARPRAYV